MYIIDIHRPIGIMSLCVINAPKSDHKSHSDSGYRLVLDLSQEGHSWKINLEEMPSKEAACGTAKDTLANIDGDEVETLLSSLEEVS